MKVSDKLNGTSLGHWLHAGTKFALAVVAVPDRAPVHLVGEPGERPETQGDGNVGADQDIRHVSEREDVLSKDVVPVGGPRCICEPVAVCNICGVAVLD